MTLWSCSPTEETVDTSVAPLNQNAQAKWGSVNVFPLNLRVSQDFSNDEKSNIENMASEWSDSINNQLSFFNTGSTTTEKSGTSDLNSLWDSVYAVYKSTDWHDELPSTALAVTQIFGVRQNTGTSSEYVEILHADVIVNYDYFSFSTGGAGSGYDLQTVMLHELGHFLGMYHVTAAEIDSVMFPSISSLTINRQPYQYDIDTLRSKYGLAGMGQQAALVALQVEHTPPSKEEVLSGENGVRITLELHANGECHHVENGKTIYSHTVKGNLKAH